MIEFLRQILAIDSPTFKEGKLVEFLHNWGIEHLPNFDIERVHNNLIITSKGDDSLPHIAFVGHSDIVPKYVEPYIQEGRLYGSGASDMKAAVGLFLWFLSVHHKKITQSYKTSIIIYAREEGTPLRDNGLYELIQLKKDFMPSIDLAIVGEPTDNTVQLGCVGSIHAEVSIKGIACHSARPWNGENALYKALPFIQYFSKLKPKPHQIFGVTFHDVLSITESESEKGRTTIPGEWTCNVNFRYAPNRSLEKAVEELFLHCEKAGVDRTQVKITDAVYAGSVIESSLFTKITHKIPCKKEAKQAWTDVAQLTELGVPAFNFGPGLTSQAHKYDEYILLEYIEKYYAILEDVFL